MPPRNERVATMVQKELAKNPGVENHVLLEKALAFDKSIRRMSPRQFHATYRLPALRAAQRGRAESGARAKPLPEPRSSAAGLPASDSGSGSALADVTPATPARVVEPQTVETSAASLPNVAPMSKSTAIARPGAAEREVVRQVLHTVAREALATEDRASFVKLLDSLDQRAAMILGIFARA